MDMNSMMSAQVAQLQQTLQLSVMNQALNLGAAGAIEMLEKMPEQPAAPHPHKGTVIDVSV